MVYQALTAGVPQATLVFVTPVSYQCGTALCVRFAIKIVVGFDFSCVQSKKRLSLLSQVFLTKIVANFSACNIVMSCL